MNHTQTGGQGKLKLTRKEMYKLAEKDMHRVMDMCIIYVFSQLFEVSSVRDISTSNNTTHEKQNSIKLNSRDKKEDSNSKVSFFFF